MEYRESLPEELQRQYDEAVEAISSHHRCAPQPGDEVGGPEEALEWFQAYTFTQGFAVVTES